MFLSVTFDDIGSNYTTSYHVTNTAWIWEWNPNSIAVRYAVFDKTVMSNAKRWVLFKVPVLENLPVNDDGGCTTEVCTGEVASTAFTDRGFSTKVWNFQNGTYPTLKYCKTISE